MAGVKTIRVPLDKWHGYHNAPLREKTLADARRWSRESGSVVEVRAARRTELLATIDWRFALARRRA